MTMKYISCWLLTIASVIFLGACSEESTPPTSLDESSITTQSGPGSVTIYWDIPDEANYYYVRVNYSTPDDGDCMKTASIYSDSLLIDNLLARYGSIDFAVCTVSRDGTEGNTYHISAQADLAESTSKSSAKLSSRSRPTDCIPTTRNLPKAPSPT